MTCTHCHDTVHFAAKFCPSCGLPMEDNTTLMGGGAYVVDDSGPNPLVIAAGALGVVLVACGIFWLAGRKDQPAETARMRPPTFASSYRYAPRAATLGALPAPAWSNPYSRPTTSGFATYAWRPSGQPAVPWYYTAPIIPPPHSVATMMYRVHRPAYISRVTRTGSTWPRAWAGRQYYAPSPAFYYTPPAPVVQPRIPYGYIYDPVHGAWVQRADRLQRAAPTRRPANQYYTEPLAPTPNGTEAPNFGVPEPASPPPSDSSASPVATP